MQGPRLQIMDIRWVLIAQFEVYGSIREVISAHSNVLSRFVSNQKMKDQTCKKSKNSHWSSHLLVAVDPDDPDDDGAERRRFDHVIQKRKRCGREESWLLWSRHRELQTMAEEKTMA
ncbi:hypothetical protein DY000_02030074 [Brassica cretica]|nr:hypothetical protein DY000_02030074 [Brassica cretica]